MEQVVYAFCDKKYTSCFATIKGDFMFSSIVITKTLQSPNTGAEHTYHQQTLDATDILQTFR